MSLTQGKQPLRQRITVLGGGAFGTALAVAAARAGNPVQLWGRDSTVMDAVQVSRKHARSLPGVTLPDGLFATSAWASEMVSPEVLLLVTPAQTTGEMARRIADCVPYREATLVLCAKGIDESDGRLLSEIARDVCPKMTLAVLSGPSFAADLANGLPTAVSVAADDLSQADAIASLFSGSNLRCYASNDVRGVELGGALKNVMAIAAGIVAGRELGASAQAALVTRGLVEMRRLAIAMGAQAETLSGLSGLGDLMLSCSSTQSRNFAYGAAVGRGDDVTDLALAEGVFTAGVATRLAGAHNVDAPIMTTVSAVLSGDTPVDEAIAKLLARPLKTET